MSVRVLIVRVQQVCHAHGMHIGRCPVRLAASAGAPSCQRPCQLSPADSACIMICRDMPSQQLNTTLKALPCYDDRNGCHGLLVTLSVSTVLLLARLAALCIIWACPTVHENMNPRAVNSLSAKSFLEPCVRSAFYRKLCNGASGGNEDGRLTPHQARGWRPAMCPRLCAAVAACFCRAPLPLFCGEPCLGHTHPPDPPCGAYWEL